MSKPRYLFNIPFFVHIFLPYYVPHMQENMSSNLNRIDRSINFLGSSLSCFRVPRERFWQQTNFAIYLTIDWLLLLLNPCKPAFNMSLLYFDRDQLSFKIYCAAHQKEIFILSSLDRFCFHLTCLAGKLSLSHTCLRNM